MAKKEMNPLGTDGFEFVEFTAPDKKGIEQLHRLFELLGFVAVARHRSKDVTLFRQGDINFLVNATPYTHFHQFAVAHGPAACAMGWRGEEAAQGFHESDGKFADTIDIVTGII